MIIENELGIPDEQLFEALKKSIEGKNLKKVLILPPDYTRMYSGAGKLTAMYYNLLKDKVQVDIMPALGTHEYMTSQECQDFFEGAVPFEKIINHNWRNDVVKIGEVPSDFVKEVSEGLVDNKIDVEVNKRLTDSAYDIILSIGQVVPHEVVGMANYSKNIFVGCGGYSMINSSHMLGAFYGAERLLGKDFSPVRKVFDYAEEKFLKNLPILYILTVITVEKNNALIQGLYIGRERANFEAAVRLSQKNNIIYVDKPIKKAVVYLDPLEFKTTWVGNKSIYRSRKAMAPGGELIILAPGIRKFGEDDQNDALIRKYGYIGRENVLDLVKKYDEVKKNLSVAAHLIHGSSDGNFKITYCTKLLTEKEIRDVNFNYMPYDEAAKIYDPKKLKDGYNTINGEEIYYISNPALGLWTLKEN
ncbi:MAG: lactate racemase domain-containing protein [Elusimicrobiota bacterium]|jgi:nickel-dependent lactate racemase|nr:lactate racemase domain-containing protein [Elusimicrobiota bacterium]